MKLPMMMCAAVLLSACGEGRQPVAESDSRAASTIEAPESAGGGPAGQTPEYGEPGGVPSQVQSSGDGAGPSAGEGSGRP